MLLITNTNAKIRNNSIYLHRPKEKTSAKIARANAGFHATRNPAFYLSCANLESNNLETKIQKLEFRIQTSEESRILILVVTVESTIEQSSSMKTRIQSVDSRIQTSEKSRIPIPLVILEYRCTIACNLEF